MAGIIGCYVFKNENDYRNAKRMLYDNMRKDFGNTDCIEFLGWYDEDEYRINCYDGISNADRFKEIMDINSATEVSE